MAAHVTLLPAYKAVHGEYSVVMATADAEPGFINGALRIIYLDTWLGIS